MNKSWTQLDGVEQILPCDGWEIEQLRRKILDCLNSNGYELVIPPLADFVESLLGGTDADLDVLTVKAPDHVSGRLFGIRADMTPQVARMAALRLPVQSSVVRLCYMGSALLARSPSVGASREILQFGAELFGSSDLNSDCEIIHLMVDSLHIAGIESLSVSLGHVGIIEELFSSLKIPKSLENDVLEALKKKSIPDLEELCRKSEQLKQTMDVFSELTRLHGDSKTIEQAKCLLSGISARIDALLVELDYAVSWILRELPDVSCHVDCALVGSYRYHTGIIFSAYGPGYGQALAKGGRYDLVMSTYGNPCPATGFSGDLRLLSRDLRGECRKGILVPHGEQLPETVISELIEKGSRVIRQMPEQAQSSLHSVCDRRLVVRDGEWVVVPMDDEGGVS
ncbi:MAG: ATP phosphoribosyltransferase regulatory subunit [Acidiferrobacterales bacterium]|nr:ATP phosphoribosyltransferase regulatory subunit [Acidiferrobacterales bacterium]